MKPKFPSSASEAMVYEEIRREGLKPMAFSIFVFIGALVHVRVTESTSPPKMRAQDILSAGSFVHWMVATCTADLPLN